MRLFGLVVLLNLLSVIGLYGITQSLYRENITLKERAIIFTYNCFVIPFRVILSFYSPLKGDFSGYAKDLFNLPSITLLMLLSIIVIMIAYKLCTLYNEQKLIEKILIIIATYCYLNSFIQFLYIVRDTPSFIWEILLMVIIVLTFIYCLIRFVLLKIKINFWHLVIIAFIFIVIIA